MSAESFTRMRGDETPGVGATVSEGYSYQSSRLVGRRGRQETCVINAAIMASSWPHKGHGGKRYNKPIVVDVDLPAWDDNSLVDVGE
jgi:hypothetical protein